MRWSQKQLFLRGFTVPSDAELNLYQKPEMECWPGYFTDTEARKSAVCPEAASIELRFLLAGRLSLFSEDRILITPTDQSCQDHGSNMERYSVYGSANRISWNTDFFSGYSWPAGAYFQDIIPSQVSEADIKVPRELSRFQHIGFLAAGDRYIGQQIAKAQITAWLEGNPFERGVNWECSMDIALRAINWIWALRFFEKEWSGDSEFRHAVANSLIDHGRHIRRNLDYFGHWAPTGIHYLADLVGLLYIGGALPDAREADSWVAFAISELEKEMDRQVLADGVCHEASTSYHRLVAELFASAACLAERIPDARLARILENKRFRKYVRTMPSESMRRRGKAQGADTQIFSNRFYQRLKLMADFTLAIRKRSGTVAQVGDNDSGRAHRLGDAGYASTLSHDHILSVVGRLVGVDYLTQAGSKTHQEGQLMAGGLDISPSVEVGNNPATEACVVFSYAGIGVIRNDAAEVIVSCGPSGQGGQGGHGHNDKNGFELCVSGHDFIVDGGCPAYTGDIETRNLFRSTEMHSTISESGIEQNSWNEGAAGLFSLVESGRTSLRRVGDLELEGMHTCYESEHTRRFKLNANSLFIRDHFRRAGERTINFNLSPSIKVLALSESDGRVIALLEHSSGTQVTLESRGATSPIVGPGAYSEGYRQRRENKRISMRLCNRECATELRW